MKILPQGSQAELLGKCSYDNNSNSDEESLIIMIIEIVMKRA
jgi:hypothetical protein